MHSTVCDVGTALYVQHLRGATAAVAVVATPTIKVEQLCFESITLLLRQISKDPIIRDIAACPSGHNNHGACCVLLGRARGNRLCLW